jgi:transposase
MFIPLDVIENLLGLQDIKVHYVNDGIIEIYAELNYILVVCPRCGKLSNQVHDHRVQPYKHLDICSTNTIIYLNLRRLLCLCDAEHPFTEHTPYVSRYQRQTIAFENYLF